MYCDIPWYTVIYRDIAHRLGGCQCHQKHSASESPKIWMGEIYRNFVVKFRGRTQGEPPCYKSNDFQSTPQKISWETWQATRMLLKWTMILTNIYQHLAPIAPAFPWFATYRCGSAQILRLSGNGSEELVFHGSILAVGFNTNMICDLDDLKVSTF